MIHMKRRTALLAAVLAVATALTACGNGGGAGDTAGSSEAGKNESASKEVTLRFSWWGNDARHQATLKAIDAYTKLHPNVKVEAEYMGFDGFYKKLLTQFAGGTAPDILQYSYEWHNDMTNFLLDLKTAKGLDISGLAPDVIQNFATYKDKMVMMPSGAFAATTFYNPAFLEKFGIPADTVWTWDKLLEEGKKVHAQDAKAYLLTADIDVLNKLILQPYVAQLTGKRWIEDSFEPGFDAAQLQKGLEYVAELYKSGVIEPFGDSSAFVGKMEQNPKWIKGEIGLLIDYVQSYDKYRQAVPGNKLGVSAFPMAPGAPISGNPIIAGTGFAVNQKSANTEEAVKFVNWLANDKEAALLLETQRGIPAAASARQALEGAGKLDPNITKGLDYANKAKAIAPNIISTNTELAQLVKDTLQKLIYQRVTAEQAAAEIMKELSSRLKELKAK
ncbi:oligogalacturonide transport system substrate-binding protein [Paenibacillus sp. UNCCL117]|uniref:ABC transporter substrate-binding protein n=1 Tax=unclassified Paenibacillus TaxID=185978 RepID=UPI0008854088|nr:MULTISPECIES: extracellular solute-binding protein [unclassified Paenibacillus]SDD48289.1 oligogalacturonide transport system substrate-binding protein [Paenibacillus sp. cl123]SFW50278.1 oligogalacturonide transport system substrate-binding protein [Paenibacillus sp. UNCCL117]